MSRSLGDLPETEEPSETPEGSGYTTRTPRDPGTHVVPACANRRRRELAAHWEPANSWYFLLGTGVAHGGLEHS